MVVVVCYHAFFLKTFSGWWMDDDPRNFGFAKELSNPLILFVNPPLAREFSGTSTVNPMLGISIWLDSHLAYRSYFFAELHNMVILVTIIVLFVLVLRAFGLSPLSISVLLLLWLLSPPMVVVSGWVAARHHLEGLLWSLGAIRIAQFIVAGTWPESGRSISGLLFCLATASLFKETFAIAVPLGVGLYLWSSHRRSSALSCAGLLIFYSIYRCWMVGFTARYDAPLLGPSAFGEFLIRLPHILVGNVGGYVLLGIVLAVLVLTIIRGELSGRVSAYILLLIGTSLAVIYPGAYALHRDWLEPLTWIRIVLLLHTGLLVGASYLLSRWGTGWLRYVAAAVSILYFAWGGMVAQKQWNQLRERYAAEGKYYLNHPDHLVYSEVPASWYLDGVRTLYAIPARHHVTRDDQPKVLAELLHDYQSIWRYSAGNFVEDPELYRTLSARAESVQR
jgi:hypothetical protein